MVTRIVNRAPLLEMAATDVGTDYVLIGNLPDKARCLTIKSNLNGAFYLTYDPSENQIWFPAPPLDENGDATSAVGSIEDHTANSPSNADVWEEPKNRPYYIKWDGSAPDTPSGKITIGCNIPQRGV